MGGRGRGPGRWDEGYRKNERGKLRIDTTVRDVRKRKLAQLDGASNNCGDMGDVYVLKHLQNKENRYKMLICYSYSQTSALTE